MILLDSRDLLRLPRDTVERCRQGERCSRTCEALGEHVLLAHRLDGELVELGGQRRVFQARRAGGRIELELQLTGSREAAA